jgi:hypothetical protein
MQKRTTFCPWQPQQTTLLPPSPREWLSEDHQVDILLDLVDELDLSKILIPAQAGSDLKSRAKQLARACRCRFSRGFSRPLADPSATADLIAFLQDLPEGRKR